MHHLINAAIFILWTCSIIFVDALPINSADAKGMQYVRSQRSLYGEVAPLAFSSHISKDELIALLEAWKEVEEAATTPAPSKLPEPASRPQAPAAGAPLTLSLPAFVPIQLSAMYNAPAQQASAAQEVGSEEDQGGEPVEEEQVTIPPRQQQQEGTASKNSHDSLLRLLSAKFSSGKPASPVLVSPVARELSPVPQAPTRIIKPIKITRYYPPFENAASIIPAAPHSATIFSHGPPHLELVPSSHLLSNLWR